MIKCADQIGIWSVGFWRNDNRRTRRKSTRAGTRIDNKLNPHATPSPGIEYGPQRWKASALTIAPSLHPFLGQGWVAHSATRLLSRGGMYMPKIITVISIRIHSRTPKTCGLSRLSHLYEPKWLANILCPC